MEGHGIFVGNTTKALLILEGKEEEVITVIDIDEPSIELVYCRLQSMLCLEGRHSLDVKTG